MCSAALKRAWKNYPLRRIRAEQALIRAAELHLQQGRQLEAEGGWGYAQMHGYIGLGMLQRLNR